MVKVPYNKDGPSTEHKGREERPEVILGTPPRLDGVPLEKVTHDVLRYLERITFLEPEAQIDMASHSEFLRALAFLLEQHSLGLHDYQSALIHHHLSLEANKASAGRLSVIFKTDREARKTPTGQIKVNHAATEHIYKNLTKKQRPAYVLSTLVQAQRRKYPIPLWLSDILTEAATKVWNPDNDVTFDEALGITPKTRKFSATLNKQILTASLVEEALQAGLKKKDAVELAQFEIEIVIGAQRPSETTVERYHRKYRGDGWGFSDIFERLLLWVQLNEPSNLHSYLAQSISDVDWRTTVLQRRLNAYREADMSLPDDCPEEQRRAILFDETASRTVKALLSERPFDTTSN